MARDPKQLRKAYEYKLGKDLAGKLSDAQISELSKYYNSLTTDQQSTVDSEIVMGKGEFLNTARSMADPLKYPNNQSSLPESKEEETKQVSEKLPKISNQESEPSEKPKPKINISTPSSTLKKVLGEDVKYSDVKTVNKNTPDKDLSVSRQENFNQEESFSEEDKIIFDKIDELLKDGEGDETSNDKTEIDSLKPLENESEISSSNKEEEEEVSDDEEEVFKRLDELLVDIKKETDSLESYADKVDKTEKEEEEEEVSDDDKVEEEEEVSDDDKVEEEEEVSDDEKDYDKLEELINEVRDEQETIFEDLEKQKDDIKNVENEQLLIKKDLNDFKDEIEQLKEKDSDEEEKDSDEEEKDSDEEEKDSAEEEDEIVESIDKMDETLKGIDALLKDILGQEKKENEREKINARKASRASEEKEAEKSTKKSALNAFKGVKLPKIGFLDRIKTFFTNILLGGVVLKILKWIQDPENQKTIDKVVNFMTKHMDKILIGLATLVGLNIGLKIVGFLRLLNPLISGLVGLLKGLLRIITKIINKSRPNPKRTPKNTTGGNTGNRQGTGRNVGRTKGGQNITQGGGGNTGGGRVTRSGGRTVQPGRRTPSAGGGRGIGGTIRGGILGAIAFTALDYFMPQIQDFVGQIAADNFGIGFRAASDADIIKSLEKSEKEIAQLKEQMGEDNPLLPKMTSEIANNAAMYLREAQRRELVEISEDKKSYTYTEKATKSKIDGIMSEWESRYKPAEGLTENSSSEEDLNRVLSENEFYNASVMDPTLPDTYEEYLKQNQKNEPPIVSPLSKLMPSTEPTGEYDIIIPLDHVPGNLAGKFPDRDDGKTFKQSTFTGAAGREREHQDPAAEMLKKKLAEQGYNVAIVKPESFSSYQAYDRYIKSQSKKGVRVLPLHFDAKGSTGFMTITRGGDSGDADLAAPINTALSQFSSSNPELGSFRTSTKENATVNAGAASPTALVELGVMVDWEKKYGKNFTQSEKFDELIQGVADAIETVTPKREQTSPNQQTQSFLRPSLIPIPIPPPDGSNIASLPPMGMKNKNKGPLSSSQAGQKAAPIFSSEDLNNLSITAVRSLYNIIT